MSKLCLRLIVLTFAFQVFMVCSAKAGEPRFEKLPIHEAFVPKFTDVVANLPVPRQPPPPIRETIPIQPTADAQWVSGYWAWIEEDQDFAWVCGVWRRPPPDHIWIPGFWVDQGGSWVWAKGFWSPVAENLLSFIAKAPPQSVDDKVPSSPGPDYFWIRGYWDYVTVKNEYTWLSGTWQKQDPNWVLSPSAYIWRPEGFVFVPMYWDHPLEERGNAYTCRGQGYSPIIIESDVIIESLWVYWPDYIYLYCHWWYLYPDFWDDCWCDVPWWGWSDWWALPWGDAWGLWWWWGHPNFFPPIWINFALSNQLPPPPNQLIQFLENVPKPNFPMVPGDKLLRPNGPKDAGPLPKPDIPRDVTPGGSIKVPNFPEETTPPKVTPPVPPTQTTPPRTYPPRDYQPQEEYSPPRREYTPEPRYPRPQRDWPRRVRPRPRWPRPTHPWGTPPSRTPQMPPPSRTPGSEITPDSGARYIPPNQSQPGGTYNPGGNFNPSRTFTPRFREPMRMRQFQPQSIQPQRIPQTVPSRGQGQENGSSEIPY